MPNKTFLVLEGFVANRALEWPLSSVDKKVSSHIGLFFEGFVTNGALEWLLIRVNPKMVSSKIALMVK